MKEIIRDSEINIYILELEEGYFYVGQSCNVKKRIIEHFDGFGANFTKKYKPIRVLRIIKTPTYNNKKALLYETFATLLARKKYGWDKVKGGKLLNFSKPKSDSLTLDTRIKLIKDRIRNSELLG